jgi:outer membrane protein TolC
MKKVIFLFLIPFLGWSQSEQPFSFDDFIQVVKTGHPTARQAELQKELGELAILKSKGQVDPEAFTEFNQKQFDDSRYYNLFDAGLKIPTWFGASFQAGYEQNAGDFLNPENSTPTDGLLYAGVSVPIGKGLLMDERRATLRQGRLYNETTKAEQVKMLNDLLLDAGKAYWNWFRAYNNVLVFEDAYTLAEQRYQAVKLGANIGERPAIDTLEAGIQRQTRQVQVRQASLEMKNARALLEIFLWQEGNIPLELEEGVIPRFENPLLLEEFGTIVEMDSLLANHPEFAQAEIKLQSLEVDRKYQSEMLKPELNLKYNFLSSNAGAESQVLLNNYTFGLQFSMSLFLRKERGDLKMTKVKIEQSERGLDQKRAQLNYKVDVALNEWQTISEQIVIQQRTVSDYNGLLNGERSLFENGESSLFMVNSREMSFIQSQLKLNELISRRFQAEIKVNHALGILNTVL